MAKSNVKGITVEIGGNTGPLDKALKSVNQTSRDLQSELRQVEKLLKLDPTNTELLAQKQKLLADSIENAKEKLDKLMEAEKQVKQLFSEGKMPEEQYRALEREIISTEQQLKSFEDQSKQTFEQAQEDMENYGQKTDEAAKSQSTFGQKLNGVIEGLGIHLPAGATKAISSLDGAIASTTAMIGAITGLVAGFAKLTVDTAKSADEIQTLSSVTGLATDTIQELRYSAELVDVSAETITDSMAKMIRSMDDARKGTGDAAEAFHKLRLRVTDNNGQLKESEQMFYEVIDALGRMSNETERDARSMAIFGRSARELNPLIEEGSKKMKEYAEQAHAMGYVVTPENIQRFANLDESMQIFHNQLTAVAGILAQAFLPILTLVFNVLNKINPTVLAIGAAIAAITITSFSVVRGIASMVAAWQLYNISTTTATATTGAFSVVSMKTILIIAAVVAAIASLIAVIAILSGKYNEARNAMNDIGGMASRATQNLNGLSIGSNAMGTSYWRGGLTWVGEQGPELVSLPAGTRILNNRQSMSMVQESANSGGDNYIFQPGSVVIDAKNVKDFTDIVDAAKSQRQRSRSGKVAMA